MTTEIDAEGLAEIRVLAGNIRDRSPRSGVAHHEAERILEILRRATTRTSEAEPVAWLHLPTGNVFGNDADYRKRLDAWKRQFGDHVIHDFEPLGRITHPTPASDDQVEAVTDEMVEAATCEFLFHRGERPYRILKGGAALWETYKLGIRAALLAAMGSTKP